MIHFANSLIKYIVSCFAKLRLITFVKFVVGHIAIALANSLAASLAISIVDYIAKPIVGSLAEPSAKSFF